MTSFFHGMVQCVLAVSLHNSETARKHVSVNLGTGALFSTVQFSCVWIFVTPWTTACQASLFIASSWNLLKLMSIELVMPSNYLILCRPLLLLSSTFSSIRVFSNESALRIRWPKYWSFSFNISSSNECSGLISFRMDWLQSEGHSRVFSYTTVQKHQFFGAQLSIFFFFSTFFIVQLLHPYMTTGKP